MDALIICHLDCTVFHYNQKDTCVQIERHLCFQQTALTPVASQNLLGWCSLRWVRTSAS